MLKAGNAAGTGGVTVTFYGPDVAYAATDDGTGFDPERTHIAAMFAGMTRAR